MVWLAQVRLLQAMKTSCKEHYRRHH